MKKYIASVLVLFVIATTTTSCDLDTYPTGSVGPTDIFATTESAQMAVRGISRLMVTWYGWQFHSGEGSIKQWHGDHPGNSMVRDMTGGWAGNFTQQWWSDPTTSWVHWPWNYYHRLIGEANNIIDNIDSAVGPQTERDHIRAQALTFRAYSFFMLSQIFSERWVDEAQARQARGLILRLTAHTPDDFPFSSLYDTYAQIYDDLKRAIDYFRSAGIARSGTHDININVAQGILARAALTRQDWALAAEMAAAARVGYPLMTNDELMLGFYRPTREWIWNSYGATAETIFWTAFHSQMGWNAIDGLWGFFAMITRELYAQIPETDFRRNWWKAPVRPGMAPGRRGSATAPIHLPEGMTVEEAEAYFDKFEEKVIAFADANPPGLQAGEQYIAHYMQVKIGRGFADPGVGFLLHMRSSEMILVEAEARARMGQEEAARNLLLALNRDSGRNPEYTVTYSGQQLIEEIWLYRDIELWGEGFNWFDLKRTGRPLERRLRAEGGSFIPGQAITVLPHERDNWRLAIPLRETDFNRYAVWPRPAHLD